MGKKMVILGAAESGVGAAVLALKKGFEVFVSDAGKIKPRYVDMLDRYGIAWEDGGHTEAKILAADEVVKSPGIPEDVAKALVDRGFTDLQVFEDAHIADDLVDAGFAPEDAQLIVDAVKAAK